MPEVSKFYGIVSTPNYNDHAPPHFHARCGDTQAGVVDAGHRYGYTGSMKATIDVPDPLYRQVKARAALEGRAIREVTIELYEGWLRDSGPQAPAARAPVSGEEWLRRWDELGAETARKAADPRVTREILLDERR